MRSVALILLLLLILAGCDESDPAPRVKREARVLVLGFDGMDPRLVKALMDAGRMPNFERVARQGSFTALQTSIPPQSPVAWSNVIAGAESSVHEIYDFIHRDPNPSEQGLAVRPYLSTSDVEVPKTKRAIPLGRWAIPLDGAEPRLLRRGGAFWDDLVKLGVDATIYRMPANYPVADADDHGHFHCLAGMGTPDLSGTYGEFTAFTEDAPPEGTSVAGGRFVRLDVREHRAKASLQGPPNPLRKPDASGEIPDLTQSFEIVRDPTNEVVRIDLGEHVVLLNRGEWSEWLAFTFEIGAPVPGSDVKGMVRLYLKSVHPKLELYASPININPAHPATPISAPAAFAAELAAHSGLYYTAGIPEDTKALRAHALNEDEFLAQARLVLDERVKQYRAALQDFKSGCLFFYFGTPDQLSHVFWRDRDPQHPGRRPEQGDKYARVIDDCYAEMDALVGEALASLDTSGGDTLIILSDHGFTGFRRGFNVNTWLLREGYLHLIDPSKQTQDEMFANVDWSKTRAYALGINSLYMNLQGREKRGIVKPAAKDELIAELDAKLRAVRDADGSPVIAANYRVAELQPGADPSVAPDLIIGYADGYRGSWASALGGMPEALLEDNLDRWSGDHCAAAHLVPGVLVTNRKLAVDDPKLTDIGPTILSCFEIAKPQAMIGRPLFER